jgi:hypothetical protein
MRRVLFIARNDLRIFLVQRGNLVGLLLVPIVMTLFIGLVNGGILDQGEPSFEVVDVLDRDGSERSRTFLMGIHEANPSLLLCPLQNDDEDVCRLDGAHLDFEMAIARLDKGTSTALLEIPEGFGVRVAGLESTTVDYYTQGEATGMDYVEAAVEASLREINAAIVAARVGSGVISDLEAIEVPNSVEVERSLYERAFALWDMPSIGAALEFGEGSSEPSVFEGLQAGLGHSVPGMGSMFVMLTVFGGMTALIVERKQGTMQRLAIAPISKAQLLGGKVLARFALGILQYLVVFAVGLAVGMDFGEDLAALVLLAMSFTLAVTALSFALGSRLQNEAQASGFGLLLSLIMAPLGGAWWPLEVTPRFMQVIGHISPIAWAMDGYTTLIFHGGRVGQVLYPIGVLALLALISFGVATRSFRYT